MEIEKDSVIVCKREHQVSRIEYRVVLYYQYRVDSYLENRVLFNGDYENAEKWYRGMEKNIVYDNNTNTYIIDSGWLGAQWDGGEVSLSKCYLKMVEMSIHTCDDIEL